MDSDLDQPSFARVRAKHVTPLPPWHPGRTLIRLDEVPAFLKKMLNVAVAHETVAKWVTKGIKANNKRVYLKFTWFRARGQQRMRLVRKADLMAFLEATGA